MCVVGGGGYVRSPQTDLQSNAADGSPDTPELCWFTWFELSRWRTMTGRSMTTPLGSSTGSLIRVSIRGSGEVQQH